MHSPSTFETPMDRCLWVALNKLLKRNSPSAASRESGIYCYHSALQGNYLCRTQDNLKLFCNVFQGPPQSAEPLRRLPQDMVVPTRGLCFYLVLENGPTDMLVYAALETPTCESTLSKVIEVVFSLLKHGDFKVGQFHVTGEYLVKCRSAEDANKLHKQVRVCGVIVIGFRKMKGVHVVPEVFPLVLKKIRDANPDEYKINDEADAGAPQALEVGAPQDSSGAGASKDDADGSGSKKRKL